MILNTVQVYSDNLPKTINRLSENEKKVLFHLVYSASFISS